MVKKPWPRWVGILALLAAMTVAYHADRIVEVSVQQMQEIRTKVQIPAFRAATGQMAIGGKPVKWVVERVENGREYGYIEEGR